MTEPIFTNNNDVADVRSAWDAVKLCVTGVAITSATTICAAALTRYFVATGNSAVSAIFGAITILNGVCVAISANKIRRTLSNLPAPRP